MWVFNNENVVDKELQHDFKDVKRIGTLGLKAVEDEIGEQEASSIRRHLHFNKEEEKR